MPASSANLGAGYDCLGLALDLTNTVTVEAVDGDGSIELAVTGEGEGALEATRSNRLVAGLEAALEVELGPRPASIGWRIEMHNRIPLSRGLGSSAAATVGGVVLGDALACAVGAPPVPPLRLLQLATTIESHPDNAAAVLLGGFVVSAQLADRVEAIRFDAPDGLQCVLYIPDRHLATEEMRRVLPGEVPLRHAVENLGRVAIGVAGIAAGRFELLADLTDRPAPRAVPQHPVPGAAAAHARRARGGRAGRVPVGRGLDDLRVRRAGRRPVGGRGGAPWRGGRMRSRRAVGDRGAAQPRAGDPRRLALSPPASSRAAWRRVPGRRNAGGAMSTGTWGSGWGSSATTRSGITPPHAGHVSSPSSSWFSSARTFADASLRSIHRTVVALRSLGVIGRSWAQRPGYRPSMNASSVVSTSAGSVTRRAVPSTIADRKFTEWLNPERAITYPSSRVTVTHTGMPWLWRSIRLADEPCQYSRSPTRQAIVGVAYGWPSSPVHPTCAITPASSTASSEARS